MQIVVGVPGAASRLAILKAHTSKVTLSKDVDLPYIAEATIGYVGADLALLCKEASLTAMKRYLEALKEDRADEKESIDGKLKAKIDIQCILCSLMRLSSLI